MDDFICKYCGKICKNKNSLVQHEVRCKENPNRISLEYLKLRDQANIKRNPSNQFIKAKELGLPKPEVTKETRQKLSKIWKGKILPDWIKEKISVGMQAAVKKIPKFVFLI